MMHNPAPGATGAPDYGAVEIKDLPRAKLIELLDKTCPLLLQQFNTYTVLCDRIDVTIALLNKGRADDAANPRLPPRN